MRPDRTFAKQGCYFARSQYHHEVFQGGRKHLRRLREVYLHRRIYFITTTTHLRQPFLTYDHVPEILIEEWQSANAQHGWMVGKYVVMPDHVHFFCADAEGRRTLSEFIGKWKEWTAKRVLRGTVRSLEGTDIPDDSARFWQAEFFDRLLRSRESYSAKWDYVCRNPVRAGLVQHPDEWPWQGEVNPLEGPDE